MENSHRETDKRKNHHKVPGERERKKRRRNTTEVIDTWDILSFFMHFFKIIFARWLTDDDGNWHL